jgi:PEGA domain-containing protein
VCRLALPLLNRLMRLPGDPLVKRYRFLSTVLAGALLLALAPADAAAQRRGGPAHGGGGRQAVVVRPAYGPYYYGGFYDPFFWGYPGWYPYGFYTPAYGGGYGRPTGSARLEVTPKQAEVYVDGYLAGTVDDFDGFLQRLDVPAGEHELTLYLPGYRTIRQNVLFRPGATVKISTAMEQLGQGASDEPRPRPNPEVAAPDAEPGRPAQPARESDARSSFGTLSLRVQPRDATVLVDGEEWQAPEGAGPLTLELGSGAHQVEVRKQGFTTYRSTVHVRAGETVALNVSLAR